MSLDRLDITFAALADPTRRAILARLSRGDASVLELAAPFSMSQPAISKHIKVLEKAGLVSRGRDAQRRPVHLEAAPLLVRRAEPMPAAVPDAISLRLLTADDKHVPAASQVVATVAIIPRSV